jgi:hypothetical protein
VPFCSKQDGARAVREETEEETRGVSPAYGSSIGIQRSIVDDAPNAVV